MKYKLIWKGETIENNLNEHDAIFLRGEYNLAYNGGVTMVEDTDASELSPDEKNTITGEKWAQFLNLKKSPLHSDRYQMTGGDKTALGVYNTIKRLVKENGDGNLTN